MANLNSSFHLSYENRKVCTKHPKQSFYYVVPFAVLASGLALSLKSYNLGIESNQIDKSKQNISTSDVMKGITVGGLCFLGSTKFINDATRVNVPIKNFKTFFIKNIPRIGMYSASITICSYLAGLVTANVSSASTKH